MKSSNERALTQAEICFQILRETPMSTAELAREIYGTDDYWSKIKVTSNISKLRRMGIDFYPEGGAGGKWKMPKKLKEFQEAINWKESRYFVGFYRLMKFVDEAENKYPQLSGTGSKLLKNLNTPKENEIHLIANKSTKTGRKPATKSR